MDPPDAMDATALLSHAENKANREFPGRAKTGARKIVKKSQDCAQLR